jgi:hypothetical protein
MKNRYLMPAARNLSTRQLVKSVDLSGGRYSQNNKNQAWLSAQTLAEKMSRQSRDSWIPELIEYTE